jgi:hypothetical protein
MDSLRAVLERPILHIRFDAPDAAEAARERLSVYRDLEVSVDAAELAISGNPSPGVVLPRLGAHLARIETVDRSRMPLQELISRLMRDEVPTVRDAPAPEPPPAPVRVVNGSAS